MRMYDIIAKKRDGGTLNHEELSFAVNGYVAGDVPDYQMSALLMAIYLRGMTDEETAMLTDVMAHSGDMVDLSAIAGIKADKHSTGGVGDKTTLVIAPIVAACGVKIAKMSGRGLGHTGGTIDKMEAVPGTRTSLTQEEFFRQVNEIGISVIGQSGKIAVADKKMYALRDVTATVGCIPLIASSIMSKKLAAGSDAILLDVTMGDGAFMKDLDGALELARQMVAIGTAHGRKVAALITDMDKPLGHNIGNALEVAESMAVLQGKGPADLTEVCLQLAGNMLVLAGKGYREINERLMPVARRLGIAELLKKYPYEVSGGQKQRAAVARAIITRPSLLLADEPTGALDSRSSDELLRLFGELNRGGQTIVMVTHSVRAASTAGRVLFIKDGEVFHQLYRGGRTEEQFYQEISGTLTLLATGGMEQ